MTAFAGQVALSWILLSLVHTCALALMAMAFGVSLREVSFGLGKVLFTRGKIAVRALPWGGFVRFKETWSEAVGGEPAAAAPDAFNCKPRVVQAIIPLAGAAALTLVASLTLSAGVAEVVAGFRQIIAAAFGPLSTAQAYIQATYLLATEQGFLVLFGVLAAKLAAFNLLPFPWSNGGQAILTLLRADSTARPPAWQDRLAQFAMWPFCALVFLWIVALGAFFF